VELAVQEVLPVASGERDVDGEPERERSEEREGTPEVVGAGEPEMETVGEPVAVPEGHRETEAVLQLERVAGGDSVSTAERVAEAVPAALVLLCVAVPAPGERLARPPVSVSVGDALRLREGTGLTECVGEPVSEPLPRADTLTLPDTRDEAEVEGDPELVRLREGVKVEDAERHMLTVPVALAEGEPEPERDAHMLALGEKLGADAVAEPLAVSDGEAHPEPVLADDAEGAGEEDTEALPVVVRDTEMLRVEEGTVEREADAVMVAFADEVAEEERDTSGETLTDNVPVRVARGVVDSTPLALALPEIVRDGDGDGEPEPVTESEGIALRLTVGDTVGEAVGRGEPVPVEESLKLPVL